MKPHAHKVLLKAQTAAKRLGTSPQTLANWRCQGKHPELKPLKLGRSIMYCEAVIEEFIERLQENHDEKGWAA